MSNYYHLSLDERLVKLTPRVPLRVWNEHEDNHVERVCLSDTINGCLRALYASEGDTYTVYAPLNKLAVYCPTAIEVIDQDITGEIWAVDETAVIKIAKIRIIRCNHIDTVSRQEQSIPVLNYAWYTLNS